MDYPCGKFGGGSFSRFGSILQTDGQNHTHTHTDADDLYTHATPVDVSNNEVKEKEELLSFLLYLSIGSSLFLVLYGGPCCLRPGRPWNSGAPKSRSSLSIMSSILTSVSREIAVGFRGRLGFDPETKTFPKRKCCCVNVIFIVCCKFNIFNVTI